MILHYAYDLTFGAYDFTLRVWFHILRVWFYITRMISHLAHMILHYAYDFTFGAYDFTLRVWFHIWRVWFYIGVYDFTLASQSASLSVEYKVNIVPGALGLAPANILVLAGWPVQEKWKLIFGYSVLKGKLASHFYLLEAFGLVSLWELLHRTFANQK